MLVVDPEKRFTVEQYMAHPWMSKTGAGGKGPQTGSGSIDDLSVV